MNNNQTNLRNKPKDLRRFDEDIHEAAKHVLRVAKLAEAIPIDKKQRAA